MIQSQYHCSLLKDKPHNIRKHLWVNRRWSRVRQHLGSILNPSHPYNIRLDFRKFRLELNHLSCSRSYFLRTHQSCLRSALIACQRKWSGRLWLQLQCHVCLVIQNRHSSLIEPHPSKLFWGLWRWLVTQHRHPSHSTYPQFLATRSVRLIEQTSLRCLHRARHLKQFPYHRAHQSGRCHHPNLHLLSLVGWCFCEIW